MRVLFLTCHLPYPPLSGGRRREYELLRRLDHEVAVVAVSKTPEQDRALVSTLMQRAPAVRHVTVTAVDQSGRWWQRKRLPSQVRRHRCPQAGSAVATAARQADLVHVEGFYLMQHVPEPTPTPVFLVEQNIEWQLCAQRRQRRDAARTRLAEVAAWQRADALGALTPEDAEVMHAATVREVALTPNGIDRVVVDRREPDPATVLFVANFAYRPNRDAAEHLVRKIFPMVRRQLPDAELLLVGNDPGGEIARRYPGAGVRVLGWVPSLAPYYARATVVVCPLRIGGGIKVKMLEALAHRKAIVSTPIGVQGFGPTARDVVRVATTSTDFACAVVEVLTQPARRRALEHAAEAFTLQLGTWEDAAAALDACWRSAARRPVSPRRPGERRRTTPVTPGARRARTPERGLFHDPI